MIESELNYLKTYGERLPTPDEETLRREFYRAASIRANPVSVEYDPNQNLGRVFTFRPNTKAPHKTKIDTIKKGIFAIGLEDGKDSVFETFVPYNYELKVPTKALDTAISYFCIRLVKEGYDIKAKGVEYFQLPDSPKE